MYTLDISESFDIFCWIANCWWFQAQYHLGLGSSYEGNEPAGPNNATPADSWDSGPLQEDYKFSPFPNNSATDSPSTPLSLPHYYLQQVSPFLS
jgi:hypothetical protein